MNSRIAVIGLAIFSSGVSAQVSVGPEHPLGSGKEPAVAASRRSGDVVVVWQESAKYAVSTDTGQTFGPPHALLPFDVTGSECPTGATGFDVGATASFHTGTIWLSAVSHLSNSVCVAGKPAGAATIDQSTSAVVDCPHAATDGDDKPFIAVGPLSGQPASVHSEVVAAAWNHHNNGALFPELWFNRSTINDPPWNAPSRVKGPQITSPERFGNAAFPLILPFGQHRGRFVLVYSPTEPGHFARSTPPRVSVSDDSGAPGSWSEGVRLNTYGPGQTGSPIFDLASEEIATNADANTWAHAAYNPINPSNIFVAFCARGGSTTNRDIFIAFSADGGVSFGSSTQEPSNGSSSQAPSSQVFRISDDSLRLDCFPPELGPTHEFLPSIAADPLGGVHLLYAECAKSVNDVENEINEKYYASPVAIGYAYWRNVGELSGAPYYKQVFAPPQSGLTIGGDGNEYQMITSDGNCAVHAAYSNSGTICHRRIAVTVCPPPGDADGDGNFTTSDVQLYLSLYGNGHAKADLNHDLEFNTQDLLIFLQSWQCGCQP